MLNCTTEKYSTLYARWLTDPGKLLDLAGLQPNERVIDLCGGTGLVAKEAVARGAQMAFVVDLNPRDPGVDVRCVPSFRGRAEEVDELLVQHIETLHDIHAHSSTCRCPRYTPDFDLVVCRQAIGYLDVPKAARAVANVLRSGGRFVFNTFIEPKWAFKIYRHQGRRYVEASAFIGRTVLHLQASPTLGIDVTRFHWYSEHALDEALTPYFHLDKWHTNRSLYYLCTKK